MNALLQLRLVKHAATRPLWQEALSFTPGVGTYMQGKDALKNFSQGNYWSGAGNLLGAGLTMVPGLGGLAGAGARFAGRMGARALGRFSMPTFGRMAQGTGNLVGRVGTGVDGLVRGGVSRLGAPGRMMAQRPMMSGLALGGGSVAAASRGENQIAALNSRTMGGNGMQPNMLMQMLRTQLPVNNPLRATAGGF